MEKNKVLIGLIALFALVNIFAFFLLIKNDESDSEDITPTPFETSIPTETPIETITPTPTETPISIETSTPTPTPKVTATPEVTVTPQVTLTPTPTSIPVVKNDTKIHFIEIKSSDATLIESNGEYGLIDASNPSSGAFSSSRNGKTVLNYLQKIGVDHLKFIIASHAHSDHIGGIIDIVNNSNLVDSSTTFIYKDLKRDSSQYGEIVIGDASTYKSNKFMTPGEDWYSFDYLNKVKQAMNSKGAIMLETTSLSESKMAKLGAKYVSNSDKMMGYLKFKMGDLTIKIYNLPLYNQTENGKTYLDINSNSYVVLITSSSGKRIWIGGDLNVRSGYEKYYASKLGGKVDIYKIQHHGNMYSNSYSLLSRLKPKYVVADNYSLPSSKAPYVYINSYGGKLYSIEKNNHNPVVFKIDSSISVESGSAYKASAKNDWYQWTDVNEDIKWVYIESNSFVTGWKQISSNWYYFDTNGIMKTGWLSDGGKWYYLDESYSANQGKMYSNTTKTINGKTYHFNSSGACDKGC